MNLREILNLSDEQYGLLFDIRRSIRYHDRRRAFYEQLHHVTSVLTILLAGSVLFDIAKQGETAEWMTWLSLVAALLATADMVLGYSKRAGLHDQLREKFVMLEIDMVCGPAGEEDKWQDYQKRRLLIEKDEPAIYRVVDGLCRNELLVAEGFSRKDASEHFFKCNFWHRWTAQLFRWDDVISA